MADAFTESIIDTFYAVPAQERRWSHWEFGPIAAEALTQSDSWDGPWIAHNARLMGKRILIRQEEPAFRLVPDTPRPPLKAKRR